MLFVSPPPPPEQCAFVSPRPVEIQVRVFGTFLLARTWRNPAPTTHDHRENSSSTDDGTNIDIDDQNRNNNKTPPRLET